MLFDRLLYVIPFNRYFRNFKIEPLSNRMFRTDAMHEVVNGFVQALRKGVVIAPNWIFML